jgi:hypothetical protein
MGARSRWIAIGVLVLIVLGLVALYWFNTNLADAALEESDGRRTWIIGAGEEVTLSVDEVQPEDHFRCEGIDAAVEGRPGRGRMVASQGAPSGVIQVESAEDGDVTVSCDTGAVFP